MWENSQDQFFQSVLFRTFGKEVVLHGYQFVSGGCINNAVKLDTEEGDLFLKWNEHQPSEMFALEADGLSQLQDTSTVLTPKVISFGEIQGTGYLLLEYLPPCSPQTGYWETLGTQLAAMHRHTSSLFGWPQNNFIGKLVQKNEQRRSWIDFFVENRLEVQLGLAIYHGHIDQKFAAKFRQIYAVLPGELPDEKPALIHGDLWSGNVMPGHGGHPYLIDPAVYYGHREVDLAFSILFGGFDRKFYQAYHAAFPLLPDFESRADLYNLYPLLVHVNLFGTSYLSGVEKTLYKYLGR